jgi:hypothetical protein
MFPRCTRTQHEQDAVQGLLVAQSRPPTLGRGNGCWQQRLDSFVQRRADFFVSVLSHPASNARRAFDDDRLLLVALSGTTQVATGKSRLEQSEGKPRLTQELLFYEDLLMLC